MSAIVLLSGGLDSCVNAYCARDEFESLSAIHFQYHQRARDREKQASQKIAKALGISLLIVELDFFQNFTGNSLTDSRTQLSQDVDIDDLQASRESAKNVWVPNRNGIFLNIAAGFAESMGAKYLIPGFNIEEAATFPDNSKDFLESCNQAFSFSTANQVELKCFTTDKNKKEIVALGRAKGLDFSMIWSCYENYEKPCGKCESCLRFQAALGD